MDTTHTGSLGRLCASARLLISSLSHRRATQLRIRVHCEACELSRRGRGLGLNGLNRTVFPHPNSQLSPAKQSETHETEPHTSGYLEPTLAPLFRGVRLRTFPFHTSKDDIQNVLAHTDVPLCRHLRMQHLAILLSHFSAISQPHSSLISISTPLLPRLFQAAPQFSLFFRWTRCLFRYASDALQHISCIC